MTKNLIEQKRAFYAGIYPSRPNEWEIDEIFEGLAGLDDVARSALLSHVWTIWPVSHSLCLAYLIEGVDALRVLPLELLPEWVRQILRLYEQKGLLGAREFMGDTDKYFLGPLRGEAGVGLEEMLSTMTHYIRGVSGRSYDFGISPLPMTDTRTIYLPEFLDVFTEKLQNMLLYKLLVTLQWGHVDSRIFHMMVGSDDVAVNFLSSFPDRELATDIFSVLQAWRVFRLVKKRFPGLDRRSRDLCRRLISDIRAEGRAREKAEVMRLLVGKAVGAGEGRNGWSQYFKGLGGPVANNFLQSSHYQNLLALYEKISQIPGEYTLGGAALLLGKFNFHTSGEVIRVRRGEIRDRFITLLAPLLASDGEPTAEPEDAKGQVTEIKETILMLRQDNRDQTKTSNKKEVVIDNEGFQISDELAAVINEITEDLGCLPDAYVQAATGIGGGGMNFGESTASNNEGDILSIPTSSYDEWDYRRAGYRASWCTLYEKDLLPVRSNFVAATLKKYHPQLKKLRRQFEMLRTRRRFVRRRRHGDEIDLDALIDALGDSRANLTPSDRLFVRLHRDERDITAMFLVDMSNSTEGWVGVAVKEALILLVEALDVVGDQYGIYGFSGMRRSKSELYCIKGLDEAYGEQVRGKIAAVKPMEYTRMGPPIRHLTRKLLEVPSGVRLLLVISDGKPEDYDDYKGRYAIEDTRKALLEARGNGIYSFCITIDKSAHDYLGHMFGRGNYVFVDSVRSLPPKMAEMYRLLTS